MCLTSFGIYIVLILQEGSSKLLLRTQNKENLDRIKHVKQRTCKCFFLGIKIKLELSNHFIITIFIFYSLYTEQVNMVNTYFLYFKVFSLQIIREMKYMTFTIKYNTEVCHYLQEMYKVTNISNSCLLLEISSKSYILIVIYKFYN